jgi:hypothetical protein
MPAPPTRLDQAMLNQTLSTTERFQINQALEKRGGLRFNYAPLNSNPNNKRTWIPFYENPMITESRKANYANTKIFLRNEPVRLYTGSEARKFKVDVHYSLIHMAAMLSPYDITNLFSVGSDQVFLDETTMVANYIREVVGRDTGSESGSTSNSAMVSEASNRDHSTEGPWGPNRWWKNTTQASEGSNYWNFALMWMMRTLPKWVEHHLIIQKVINNIRSSVIGTAQMPVKGPPIVELKWGSMYDFTPCIITDYKITPIENAGYDAKSLTSQRLKISLSLEEMRNINGNQWGNPAVGGDLPGWDSIQDLGSIDPVPIEAPMRGGSS